MRDSFVFVRIWEIVVDFAGLSVHFGYPSQLGCSQVGKSCFAVNPVQVESVAEKKNIYSCSHA